jgi:hypothetical protein
LVRVYELRHEVALLNVVHGKHFRNEYFVSKIVYLSNIFEKFSTLNTSMQGNHTRIIVVTDTVGLVVRKLEGNSLDMFSRLKDSVEESIVETSDQELFSGSRITCLICSPVFSEFS